MGRRGRHQGAEQQQARAKRAWQYPSQVHSVSPFVAAVSPKRVAQDTFTANLITR